MLQPPSNEPPNNPQIRHVDLVSAVAATTESDFEAPPLNRHRVYPEGSGLTSSPSQLRHPVDGGDPFPSEASEGTNTFPPSYTHLRPNGLHLPSIAQTPLIPTPEFNLNTDPSCGLVPRHYDYPSTATWDISSNDFGELSASIVAYGSRRDNRTHLDTKSIPSTSSNQTSVITHSATSRPSRNRGSFAGAGYGYRSAPPNFRSAGQHRYHPVPVSPIALGRVSAPRQIRKKYWCEEPECGAGFTQNQGLERHRKDVHGPRLPCPLCKDFEWSPGRKYTLKKHFEEKHPELHYQKFCSDKTQETPCGH